MLGVAVGALRRHEVGAQEEIDLRVGTEDLPELGLAGDLQVYGKMTNLGAEGIEVAIEVDGSTARECARCLAPVTVPLHASAEETFALSGPWPSVVEDTLDVKPMVSEAVLLEEPLRVLCRPECAGICPSCGKDLNDGPCECTAEEVDPRLKPLKKLLESREEKR
ncbi:MAG: DUF177 domain-containing protein [Thermaerobacter sp.]|nr:DUF177 domain-containing protein [Thermaerobacter sp.]